MLCVSFWRRVWQSTRFLDIRLWLLRVFVAVCWLSLVAVSGPLFLAVRGALIVVASLVAACGL